MYRIFFSKNFLAKRQQMNEMWSTLTALPKGTELHVHTKQQTYYDAQLVAVNEATHEVTLIIDRFYEHGGQPITVHCRDITSVEFPADALVAASQQQTIAIGTNEKKEDDE